LVMSQVIFAPAKLVPVPTGALERILDTAKPGYERTNRPIVNTAAAVLI
jgi:hypothetical protein